MQDVVARDDRENAGNVERFRGVDRSDAGVRHRAPQDLAVAHARHQHVRKVKRSAGDFRLVIEPAGGLAYFGRLHRLS